MPTVTDVLRSTRNLRWTKGNWRKREETKEGDKEVSYCLAGMLFELSGFQFSSAGDVIGRDGANATGDLKLCLGSLRLVAEVIKERYPSYYSCSTPPASLKLREAEDIVIRFNDSRAQDIGETEVRDVLREAMSRAKAMGI